MQLGIQKGLRYVRACVRARSARCELAGARRRRTTKEMNPISCGGTDGKTTGASAWGV